MCSRSHAIVLLATILFAGAADRLTSGQYDASAPEPLPPMNGTLFLHGGGPVDEAARRRFLELAGGEKAKLVIIPTADTRDALNPRKQQVWQLDGELDLEVVHVESPKEANDPRVVDKIENATAVWFSGGKQTQVIDMYQGTKVAHEIRQLLQRGGVVGGTSAGAAIASKRTLVYDEIKEGFDFLPGVIVDQHFLAKQRLPRLKRAIDAHPDQVGLGIDEGTAAIIRGRKVEVLGASSVTLYLAGSKNRAPRLEMLRHGEQADLIAWRRAAHDRAFESFPFEAAKVTQLPHGSLVIAGGGALPDSVLATFIELAGGDSARIVYVPCTEDEVVADEPAMVETLRQAGAADVQWLHTKDRLLADRASFYAPLLSATGVWFGGGRQWNLVDSYQNTETHRQMHRLLVRGGVIGGSSAGASIQGDYMPRGNPLGNRDMMAEGYERGLGFLTGVAIDQHFAQRRRQPDMAAFKKAFPHFLGIGIDEGTALVVRGGQAKVLGKGQVAFYDQEGSSERIDAFVRLADGDVYDLAARNVLRHETR